MTEFIFMQSIINYRIPLLPNGKLGSPEILSKWTKDMNAPKKKTKVKKETVKVEAHAEIEEVTF